MANPNKESMFHNKAEAWGARAIAKVGVNWERGWKGRVEGTILVSGGLLSTFLGLAVAQFGGSDMTGLWVVLTILSAWILVACIWLSTRYSGRSQDRRLVRMERKLDKLDKLDEIAESLRSLAERLDK